MIVATVVKPVVLLLLLMVTEMISVIDARALREDRPVVVVVEVNNDKKWCDIPGGQFEKGLCRLAADCEPYRKLLNESELNSLELDRFIDRIKCGDESVCCPTTQGTYPIAGVGAEIGKSDDEDAAVCGSTPYTFRIKGGTIAEIDEFPWTAMLLRQSRKTSLLYYHCGGVLIGRRFVLTAAHCIAASIISRSDERGSGSRPDRLKFIRLREYIVQDDPDCVLQSGFKDCSEPKLDMKPRREIIHPDFHKALDGSTSDNRSGRQHDIGLIQIDPVPAYSDFLLPICLPEVGLDGGLRVGAQHTVAGWGKTDFFQKELGSISWSPIKLKVALPFVDWDRCRDVYRGMNVTLQSTQICAGGKKAKDSCAGDSGSPLMHYDMQRGVWALSGIASFGMSDCGQEGVPGVYTSVREYLSWIKEIVNKG